MHIDPQDKLLLQLLKGVSEHLRHNKIEVEKAMMSAVVDHMSIIDKIEEEDQINEAKK